MGYIPYNFSMRIFATYLQFLDNVTVEVTFQDGKVFQYNMSQMFNKYPQLKALENRSLFLSGHLDPGGYGIIWNDELDFNAMSIYESGILVKELTPTINQKIGLLLAKTRDEKGITQSQLAKLSHIDQGDISKLEKGLGNPTISKISKLFTALNCDIDIKIL